MKTDVATRSIHALLDTASEDDELDGKEEEHTRLHDLLVEATRHSGKYEWPSPAITQVRFAQ